MDAKITKSRLSKLLSYDWVKIIAVMIAVIFAWWIVFRVTKTDMRPSQDFTVVSYYCNDELTSGADALLRKAKTNGVFSYETSYYKNVDGTEFGEGKTSEYFESRLALSEPDVLLVPTTVYNAEENPTRTYLDAFFNVFFDKVYPLEPDEEYGFLYKMAEYLNGFYDGGYETGTLNAEKVERNFRARVKKYNDKRFKKEANFKAGLTEELVRIQKYRDALVQFNDYLALGVVTLSTIQVTNDKGEVLWEGKSAINLCPDESKMSNLSKYFSYSTSENGQTVKTAKDMHALIFRYDDVEPGYEYEALLYINHLIANSLS